MARDDYVLGTDDEELLRLGTQHQTWVRQAYAIFERGGLATGDRVLDLGSGPGFTTFELATLVGPTGRVVAHDKSARFLAHVEAEARRRGQPWVETRAGDIASLGHSDAAFDAAYARWLFCWLEDPEPALREVARVLRPGGALLLQEYVDWGALSLLPRRPAFARAVAACLAAFAAAGGDIDVGARLPALAPACGFTLAHCAPLARAGAPGSLVWRWVTDFLRGFLPGLVAAGSLGDDDLAEFERELREIELGGEGLVLAPVMFDAVLRKPRA